MVRPISAWRGACARWLLALCCALALPSVALSQPELADPTGSVPTTTITTTGNLTPAQKASLTTYTRHWTQRLSGEDVAQRQEARSKLIEPFLREQILPSVSFRFEYTEAVMPTLREMVRSNDQHVATQAIYVLGRLATKVASDSLADILETAESPALRYASAQSLGATLRQIVSGQSVAMSDRDVRFLLQRMAARLADEPDGRIAARVATSLSPLVNPPRGSSATQYRNDTLRAICERMGERLASGRNSASAMQAEGAIKTVLDTSWEPLRIGSISDERILKASARLGGEILAHIEAVVIASPTMPEDRRNALATLASDADRMVQRVRNDLVGRGDEPVAGDLLRSGDIAGFRQRVGVVIDQLRAPQVGQTVRRAD